MTYIAGAVEPSAAIHPGALPRVGAIDERFQSYNIEMVEVTGGRFWKPYASKAEAAKPDANQPTGMDPSLYEYRSPIDLSNTRLRKLATALGPTYVRVSGTWANTTYFQLRRPGAGNSACWFQGYSHASQWKGVVDFSPATNSEIVTSVATSDGTRDASGVWTPNQAQQLFDYTKSVGGKIAAAEYMNEPTFAEMGGAPKGYDAAAFGRDFTVFLAFAKEAAPDMLILGPGGVGEGSVLASSNMHPVPSASILAVTGPVFDAFSYHSYGGVSSRCKSMGASANTSEEAALTTEWLARSGKIEEYYRAIRDRYEPGKPTWLTETAQTACGGDRWASTFLDTFRYLNQLGVLAKDGVQVHMHNTLAASDYGLLDEKTYEPRPNYWAALLWRRLMGTTVLDPGASPSENLHLYAHCQRDQTGGVVLLAINADRKEAYSLDVAAASERYTLTSHELTGKQIQLNGSDLKLGAGDALPELKQAAVRAGKVAVAPESITFLVMPKVNNGACQK